MLALLIFVGSAACGDTDTDDVRGYTKAPLEKAGWIIEPEPETRMSELGQPVLHPPAGEAVTESSE